MCRIIKENLCRYAEVTSFSIVVDSELIGEKKGFLNNRHAIEYLRKACNRSAFMGHWWEEEKEELNTFCSQSTRVC